ncbi:MAG: hypothetical protein IKX10_07205 [Lachnospiraceae bacterium]|nr:hypothetical protein [Lachnospiraceae bacterium]
MQCKFCGAELPAGAYKCDMCGQNIHSKKTPMEGGMFGDVLMTAPTEYKSVPIKEPSKLPKIIAISAAALVVVVGIIIALVIFLKPKKPVDQLIDGFFKTGALDSMEIILKTTEEGVEEKITGYYEFDEKEKEGRLFMMNEKKKENRMYVFTPSASYIVKEVTPEEYGRKNGKTNFEGHEYTTYASDLYYYVLERDEEKGKYIYDILAAMRKDSWDDFYEALAKYMGLYSNSNKTEQNQAAVDEVRNAIETVKKDLKDSDKQKNVFHFSTTKENGLTVCKLNPSFTDIISYLIGVAGNTLDEETKQGLMMYAALSALTGQSNTISVDIAISEGHISNGMINSEDSDMLGMTTFTIQNANKTQTPGRADEFYRAYTRCK